METFTENVMITLFCSRYDGDIYNFDFCLHSFDLFALFCLYMCLVLAELVKLCIDDNVIELYFIVILKVTFIV